MSIVETKKKKETPKVYEKPIFVKAKAMTFPRDIIENFNGGRFCVQCTGCHGCR